MRSILSSLPIRWQITVLHTAILALVLCAGAFGLWNAQRTFQYDGMLAKQLTEVRALIPEELNLKLEAGIYPPQQPDPATLKQRYDKVAAAILTPGADPAAVRKKIALINPKLADQVFGPGAVLPARDELDKIVLKIVTELFSPQEDPLEARSKLMALDPALVAELFPNPTLDQTAFQKYLAGLVQELSAKDRGVVMLTPDGSVLAQSSFGPACAPASFVSKDTLAHPDADGLYQKLWVSHYVQQFEPGQLTLLLPVIWQGAQPLALAQICLPTDAIDAGLSQLAFLLLIGWVLVLGVATALGVTATRRVLQPLDQIVATTRRIAAGDLQQRAGLPSGRTEIAQLGAAFDAMVARLEQAFAAQRRFVADAAHELRTPLTALSASVELLLMGAAGNDRATAQRLLRHLDAELGRVIRLTNDLLALSWLDARPRMALCPTDLGAVLRAGGEQSRALLQGQRLIVDVEPDLWVAGDADRLRQVVLNLLDNARKYTPTDGQITLRAHIDHQPPTPDHRPPTMDGETRNLRLETSQALQASSLKPQASAESVVVEVRDTGVGIPADALPHLFEPFYRVDGARARASGGSGLGLAIVRAIVDAHHGQLDIWSAPSAGTCVTLRLPLLPRQELDLVAEGHSAP